MGLMAITYTREELISTIKERLSPPRFTHTINVAKEAEKLAHIYNINREAAILAGLLHDYAREFSERDLLHLAQEAQWPINIVEKENPMLLHGPVAAYLVEKDLGISDPAILQAIRFHTTGCSQMYDVAKIVFLADMLEPTRSYPGVEELRKLAYRGDLDYALLKSLEHSLLYVMGKGFLIHPLSVEARNDLLIQLKQQRGEG